MTATAPLQNRAPGKTAPQTGTFELERWPFYWLTRANGRYLQVLATRLRDVDLDIPRWRVLMLLESGKARSMSYLAKEAISKLPTMTRITQRMEEAGLVRTRPRETDARVTEVLLTPAGEAARAESWAVTQSMFDTAFQGMDAEDVDTLNRLLRAVESNLFEAE